MMQRIGRKLGTVAAVLALAAGSAWGLSPEDKCEADKNKIAGKYAFCRQNAEAKAIKKGAAPDYSKCDDKLLDKWGRAEQKAIDKGTACIDSVTDTAIQSFVTSHADALATALDGGTLPADVGTCNTDLATCEGDLTTCDGDLTTCNGDLGTCNTDLGTCNGDLTTCNGDLATCNSDLNDCQNPTCGDNSAGFGEQCDGADLDGATCAGLGFVGGTLACDLGCEYDTSGCTGGFPASGQTTAYGTGSDGDVEAGDPLSYTDNGDGTITDNNTGLMWEKKDDSAGIHDKDKTYTWSTGTNDMDGTITTTFLASLNGGGGFAGYTDWRIPNAKELQSIVDYEVFSPSVDPAFHQSATCTGCTDVTLASCSCTGSSFYWSSTTYVLASNAWNVDFVVGDVDVGNKTTTQRARAVRGGL